jgi:hypothetical protein
VYVDAEMIQARFGETFGFQDQMVALQTDNAGSWDERYPENAGFQALRFRYNRTTDEWIPLFAAVNSRECFDLCSALLYTEMDTHEVVVELYVPGTVPAAEDVTTQRACYRISSM